MQTLIESPVHKSIPMSPALSDLATTADSSPSNSDSQGSHSMKGSSTVSEFTTDEWSENVASSDKIPDDLKAKYSVTEPLFIVYKSKKADKEKYIQ